MIPILFAPIPLMLLLNFTLPQTSLHHHQISNSHIIHSKLLMVPVILILLMLQEQTYPCIIQRTLARQLAQHSPQMTPTYTNITYPKILTHMTNVGAMMRAIDQVPKM
jgi:hypothetical protein